MSSGYECTGTFAPLDEESLNTLAANNVTPGHGVMQEIATRECVVLSLDAVLARWWPLQQRRLSGDGPGWARRFHLRHGGAMHLRSASRLSVEPAAAAVYAAAAAATAAAAASAFLDPRGWVLPSHRVRSW